MNYRNAIKLYGDLVERVFSGCAVDVPELATNVVHLRQSLSCYVCYDLLKRPCSAKDSKCQHYVCYDCRHGKLRLPTKKSCSWCSDSAAFEEDLQLQLMVNCFVELCQDMVIKECCMPAFKDAIGRRAKILLNLKIDGSEVAKKAEAYVKEGAALAVPIETSDEDSEDFKKPSAPIQRNREPCQ